jgi:hypothetical protein
VQLSEATVGKRCNKHINNLRNTWMIKLPPRFKIFHNVSEDYYFIKERFCFFWYRTERDIIGYDGSTVITHYESVEAAETAINQWLRNEKQSKIPDEIKLVKEL